VATKKRQEIPKEQIPPDPRKVGAMLMTKAPNSQPVPIKVHQVKDKTIIVDFNHPAARSRGLRLKTVMISGMTNGLTPS
jgi:FKBP-type peptidyl-prolyl cis-trans isomerase 2